MVVTPEMLREGDAVVVNGFYHPNTSLHARTRGDVGTIVNVYMERRQDPSLPFIRVTFPTPGVYTESTSEMFFPEELDLQS